MRSKIKHPKVDKKQSELQGFTMVEFSLATAFIALLLISIAIITSNIVSIYQKGLSIKSINSVGRGLIDEFSRALAAAPSVDAASICKAYVTDNGNKTDPNNPVNKCKADNAQKFIFRQKVDSNHAFAGGEGTGSVQLGGAFCTGKYSYIWDTHYGAGVMGLSYFLHDGTQHTVPTDFGGLLRVEDANYRVCADLVTNQYQDGPKLSNSTVSIELPNSYQLTHEPDHNFLEAYDLKLDLYELAIFPLAQDPVTLRTFMAGSFVLATDRGNINLTRSGDYCDIKNLANEETSSNLQDLGSEFNYCAINKFNFAARTAGM